MGDSDKRGPFTWDGEAWRNAETGGEYVPAPALDLTISSLKIRRFSEDLIHDPGEAITLPPIEMRLEGECFLDRERGSKSLSVLGDDAVPIMKLKLQISRFEDDRKAPNVAQEDSDSYEKYLKNYRKNRGISANLFELDDWWVTVRLPPHLFDPLMNAVAERRISSAGLTIEFVNLFVSKYEMSASGFVDDVDFHYFLLPRSRNTADSSIFRDSRSTTDSAFGSVLGVHWGESENIMGDEREASDESKIETENEAATTVSTAANKISRAIYVLAVLLCIGLFIMLIMR